MYVACGIKLYIVFYIGNKKLHIVALSRVVCDAYTFFGSSDCKQT